MGWQTTGRRGMAGARAPWTTRSWWKLGQWRAAQPPGSDGRCRPSELALRALGPWELLPSLFSSYLPGLRSLTSDPQCFYPVSGCSFATELWRCELG